MASHTSSRRAHDRGFSLIELLIVVVIILIMAAVALPNIGHYIKNYRIKGAAQLVGGELNAARSRAIMSNTNRGVSFVILDQDSFRFVQEDLLETDPPSALGGLRTLPTGVIFVAPGGTATISPGPTLRFLRLGGFCNPAQVPSTTCQLAVDLTKATQSSEGITPVEGPYIAQDANGNVQIRVREVTTNLERTVQIAPGGRVLPQP